MGIEMRFNHSMLEARLTQIGERAVKGVSDVMRRTAIRIRDLARDYAPIKTGLLERSIDYSVLRDANRRNSYIVFINLDAARLRGAGVLGDYAFIMHDELHPHGRARSGERYFNLGVASKAKAASGKKVGGRFLRRAVKDGMKDILGNAAAEVRKATSSRGSSVGVQYQRATNESED
jgi:hypothetical protein